MPLIADFPLQLIYIYIIPQILVNEMTHKNRDSKFKDVSSGNCLQIKRY